MLKMARRGDAARCSTNIEEPFEASTVSDFILFVIAVYVCIAGVNSVANGCAWVVHKNAASEGGGEKQDVVGSDAPIGFESAGQGVDGVCEPFS